ncbi:MAG: hypothetical protein IJU78_00565 [Clostridia bacterium]|nr:hypothetical protein [Clostridia bacterium]
MSQRSEKLTETKLWKAYIRKKHDTRRSNWVEDVYNAAADWLTHVPVEFKNYTLHDGRHILNVIDLMGEILGDQIKNLSVCECELLILAAALHDIGMVYDPEGLEKAKSNKNMLNDFLREYAPDKIDLDFDELSESMQQNYRRWLHPFRLPELLNRDAFKFTSCPSEIVPQETVIAVCQAHGEDENFLKEDSFNYLEFYDADPRFCALMLRLADLLDFDHSRAPEVLFSFAAGNERSMKEFRKHMASLGFKFLEKPSDKELGFAAKCKDPDTQFGLLAYLDMIDKELILFDRLKKSCEKDWQRGLPIPRSVSRDGIKSIGYDSDPFSLTMDQEQILSLLTGENLYDRNDVFVRELLQNAIDATLLRAKLDKDFNAESEEAAIRLWEGYDESGALIFRIDDCGTGMTRGMMKRYFLKVGNSYYNSDELKRDLRDNKVKEDYRGISRFGIGFLSCFLCGTGAEISTLYWDERKNEREHDQKGTINGYGLRMEIPKLNGYYVLRDQAQDHQVAKKLPFPADVTARGLPKEPNGYRQTPGTSIVVKLDPGKLGGVDLRRAAAKYLCGARMPVYYNGERIGRTYKEIMDEAHALSGERVYELPEWAKRDFDEAFPWAAGKYPRIKVTTTPLDEGKYALLPGMSGVAMKYEVIDLPIVQVGDQKYILHARWEFMDGRRQLKLTGQNEWFEISLAAPSCKTLPELTGNTECRGICCAYTAVLADADMGNGVHPLYPIYSLDYLFYLEGKLRPTVDVGRSRISALPAEAALAMEFICTQLFNDKSVQHINVFSKLCGNVLLPEWRRIRNTEFGKALLPDNIKPPFFDVLSNPSLLSRFKYAAMQDDYDMTIRYERSGLPISYSKKTVPADRRYDRFPPMKFCKAADDDSRSYLCDELPHFRYGITEDHPFAAWLLAHADELAKRFPRQLRQITDCLIEEESDDIISTVNGFRTHLDRLRGKDRIDITGFPELSLADFWCPTYY